MKIDYIENVGSDFLADHMIRLFDFDNNEILQLHQIINNELIINKGSVDFSKVEFVQCINCSLTFDVSDDAGIFHYSENTFVCRLTVSAYVEMTKLIEPFLNDLSGYQFLIDPPTNVELLLSAGGGW
jgi:hypothetical protein